MRRRWNAHEIRLLAQRYPQEGPTQLAQDLGRSENSVCGFANRLGLRSLRRLERQVTNRARNRKATAVRSSLPHLNAATERCAAAHPSSHAHEANSLPVIS